MITDDTAHFFDTIADRYDRVYALSSDESRRRMRRVLDELRPSGARVLDLGVGTGRELTSLLDAGHRPTGLDISRAMLARCARRARPIPLVKGDFWAAPLPFDEGSFDAALALHGTLAHPPDDTALGALSRELARVVVPGGLFFAEVPALAWLDAIERNPVGVDRRLIRTGERTCLYEDRAAGVSIRARLLDDEAWRAAFAPHWDTHIEPMSELERVVRARRL